MHALALKKAKQTGRFAVGSYVVQRTVSERSKNMTDDFTFVIGIIHKVLPNRIKVYWGMHKFFHSQKPLEFTVPLNTLHLLSKEVGEQLMDRQQKMYNSWRKGFDRAMKIKQAKLDAEEARRRAKREAEEERQRREEEAEEERQRREEEAEEAEEGFLSADTFCRKYGCTRGQTIKGCYRKKSLKWHPDKNPGRLAWATEKFKELSNDYHMVPTENQRHKC